MSEKEEDLEQNAKWTQDAKNQGDEKNSTRAPKVPKMGKSAKLAAEVEELAQKNGELLQDLQRTRADFENYRKQAEAQRERAGQLAREETVAKLLPLLDDMERAIAAHPEELGVLEKNLTKTLGELGLERIDSVVGTEFNPDFHEAVTAEGEGAREVVAETLRTGYLYDGGVVRAALVRVKRED